MRKREHEPRTKTALCYNYTTYLFCAEAVQVMEAAYELGIIRADSAVDRDICIY